MFVIGKCYSTDPKVYDQLKEDGVNISSMSAYFDSHAAYDDEFDQTINDFFESITKKLNFEKPNREDEYLQRSVKIILEMTFHFECHTIITFSSED